MKLEQIVASRELSERMAELKIFEDSLFWWVKTEYLSNRNCYEIWDYKDIQNPPMEKEDYELLYSAPTVAEMGEKLPTIYTVIRNDKYWVACEIFWNMGIFKIVPFVEIGDTEANARAKILIYLKGNKLI